MVVDLFDIPPLGSGKVVLDTETMVISRPQSKFDDMSIGLNNEGCWYDLSDGVEFNSIWQDALNYTFKNILSEEDKIMFQLYHTL